MWFIVQCSISYCQTSSIFYRVLYILTFTHLIYIVLFYVTIKNIMVYRFRFPLRIHFCHTKHHLFSLYFDVSLQFLYLPLISVIKPDNFHHLKYSDYCLHLHWYAYKVSVDTPFGLLQVYYIKFGSLQNQINLNST